MGIDYEKIESKKELIGLIQRLRTEDSSKRENLSTPSFLEALAAWLENADGFYQNVKLETSAEKASWQLFADALQAATIYE